MNNSEIKSLDLENYFVVREDLHFFAVTAKISNPEYKIVHQWANDYDMDTCNTYRRNICPDNEESVILAM